MLRAVAGIPARNVREGSQEQTHAPQQLAALFDYLVGGQLTIHPGLAGRDRLDWKTQDASAALSGRDLASFRRETPAFW
jgi:hypothetical protein